MVLSPLASQLSEGARGNMQFLRFYPRFTRAEALGVMFKNLRFSLSFLSDSFASKNSRTIGLHKSGNEIVRVKS